MGQILAKKIGRSIITRKQRLKHTNHSLKSYITHSSMFERDVVHADL